MFKELLKNDFYEKFTFSTHALSKGTLSEEKTLSLLPRSKFLPEEIMSIR